MKRSRGFTLFEVIVAITIVVILIGTMASTLSLAFKSKRSSEDLIFAVRDIQAVGDICVQELENAAAPNPNVTVDPLAAQFNQQSVDPTTGQMTGTTSSVPMYLFGPFQGDQQSVAFYATGPEPKAAIQSDARYVLFSLQTLSDGTVGLTRRVETNLLSEESPTNFPTGLEPEVLVNNVQSITFLYYDGSSWNTTWDSSQQSNTLPYAVSIELTLNPLHEGGQARVIKRFATLWCADASNYAAGTLAATATTPMGP